MAKKNATRGTPQGSANERKTAQYADQSVMTGAGGEVHQTAGGDTPVLTTQQGIPCLRRPKFAQDRGARPHSARRFSLAREALPLRS